MSLLPSTVRQFLPMWWVSDLANPGISGKVHCPTEAVNSACGAISVFLSAPSAANQANGGN